MGKSFDYWARILRREDVAKFSEEWKALRGQDGALDLSEIDLSGANLQGVYLAGVALNGADLRQVDLRGADLRGANLEGADLRGAYFNAGQLRLAKIDGAIFADVSVVVGTAAVLRNDEMLAVLLGMSPSKHIN